jgi:hypothetical protein
MRSGLRQERGEEEGRGIMAAMSGKEEASCAVHFATEPEPGSIAALVSDYATVCGPFRIPYTFDKHEVTCPRCLERMKPQRKGGAVKSSSDEEGPVLRHIDLPLEPGARIVIKHSPGWALLDPLDPLRQGRSAAPQGYTIDINGDRWRAVFVSSSIGPEGAFLELEIEGRYPE